MTRRLLALLALFVIAPLLAALIIAVLLLFGVEPHLVFLPGHFVRSQFAAPNAVGVLTTLFVWWALIVLLWLGLRRLGPRAR